VTGHPLPATPVISWNGTQVSTAATGVAYQWLLNNNAVAGATAATYLPAAIGEYRVQITDNNGCQNLSEGFSLVVTAVNNTPSAAAGYTVKLIPNPAVSELTLLFGEQPTTELTIQLISSAGQVMKQVQTRKQTVRIPVAALPAGNYMVKIIGTNFQQTEHLLILH
jgi:hypothetical protein